MSGDGSTAAVVDCYACGTRAKFDRETDVGTLYECENPSCAAFKFYKEDR